MQRKSQTFAMIQHYVKNMQIICPKYRIKQFHSDNGGEFISNEFKNYCLQNGILKTTSAPYCPQQNGIAERVNRTILDRTRCLLNESGLCNEYWDHAVRVSVYIKNRVLSNAVSTGPGNQTPYEKLTGERPSVAHIRVFGCLCYVHVPGHQRGKLDDVTEQALFLGYSEEHSSYKVQILSTGTIMYRRCLDVTFEEMKRVHQSGISRNIGNLVSLQIYDPRYQNQDGTTLNDSTNSSSSSLSNSSILNSTSQQMQIDSVGQQVSGLDSALGDIQRVSGSGTSLNQQNLRPNEIRLSDKPLKEIQLVHDINRSQLHSSSARNIAIMPPEGVAAMPRSTRPKTWCSNKC
jgi:hypothetical protein